MKAALEAAQHSGRSSSWLNICGREQGVRASDPGRRTTGLHMTAIEEQAVKVQRSVPSDCWLRETSKQSLKVPGSPTISQRPKGGFASEHRAL